MDNNQRQEDGSFLVSPWISPGYENGTVFKALHKPFYGGACGGKDND